MRRVVVLGSTGSIGTQTLDIVAANRERFAIVGLSAGGGNPVLLAQQAIDFDVEVVAIANGTAAQDFQLALYAHAAKVGYAEGTFRIPKLLVGPEAATELAAMSCDVVVNGITGAVGLGPTVATLKAGTTLALANKESLVIGGHAVTSLAQPNQIVPVDSEHSAIAQALLSGTHREVSRLILTASGGPFRGYSNEQLQSVTVDEALNHPTWKMGPVVTVNSATMMNKGLEVIEAHLLFDIPMDRIDVVVHPQSVVHSMVEFVDGSTIAQASPPDMHLPIALGLDWPSRVDGAARGCDWTQATQWTFEPVDEGVFGALNVARIAGTRAGTAPAVMNAANEVAVELFLAGELTFTGITQLANDVLAEHLRDGHVSDEDLTIEAVLHAARWAELRSREVIASGSIS